MSSSQQLLLNRVSVPLPLSIERVSACACIDQCVLPMYHRLVVAFRPLTSFNSGVEHLALSPGHWVASSLNLPNWTSLIELIINTWYEHLDILLYLTTSITICMTTSLALLPRARTPFITKFTISGATTFQWPRYLFSSKFTILMDQVHT